MSVANKTTNYDLPLFEENDLGDWFDLTPAMQTIADEMKANKLSANSAIASAQNAIQKSDSAVAISNTANATANNAVNIAGGMTLSIPVTVSSVSGSPLQSLPICYRNNNNDLIDIYLASSANKMLISENQALFKLDIHPAIQRVIGASITIQVISTEGKSEIYFSSLLIDTDGICRISSGIDLTSPTIDKIAMFINGIYNTYGWYN